VRATVGEFEAHKLGSWSVSSKSYFVSSKLGKQQNEPPMAAPVSLLRRWGSAQMRYAEAYPLSLWQLLKTVPSRRTFGSLGRKEFNGITRAGRVGESGKKESRWLRSLHPLPSGSKSESERRAP
jgi:hypothetical protein